MKIHGSFLEMARPMIPTTTMTANAIRSVFTTGGVGGVGKMVNSVMIKSLNLSSETDVTRKTRSSEVCKNEIRRNDQGELTEIDQRFIRIVDQRHGWI